MKFIKRTALALSLVGAAFVVQADPVTYDFNVTAYGSMGGSYSGFFTFDNALFTGVAGPVTGVNLGSDFSFTFGSTTYDETTAFIAMLTFDAGGAVTDLSIGNDCSGGSCTVTPGIPGFSMNGGTFQYATADANDLPGFPGSYELTLRTGGGTGGGDLPEPASLALVLSAGLLAYGTRRRA